MTSEKLLEALGEMDERLLLPAMETKHRRPKGRTALLAAALCLLLLSTAAVAAGGSLSGALRWFGGRWEKSSTETMSEGQVELLTAMTQPLGLVAEDKGVTIMAESVTVGPQSATVLFRIEVPEFAGMEKLKLYVENFETVMTPVAESYGAAWEICGYDEAQGCYWWPVEIYASEPLDGSIWTLTLRDISLVFGLSEENPEQRWKGSWRFEIPLSLSAAGAETLYIDRVEVDCLRSGEPGAAVIEGLEITPTGIRFIHNEGLNTVFQIYIELTDGTLIKVEGGVGRLYHGEDYTAELAEGVERQYIDGITCDESHSWYVPVNLEEVAALRFGDSVLELK